MGGSKTDGDMVAGDKMDGSMMKGDTGQKNAMDMSSGSSGAVVDMSVAVISSYKGGNAPVEQVSQPTMTMGMMHKVNPRSYAVAAVQSLLTLLPRSL